MKKTVILLIALTMSIFVMAQEKTTKLKEVGLTFRNLDQFGFSYKVGTTNELWRFNMASISGSNQNGNSDNDFNDRESKHFGLNFSGGKEYRKPIAKNLEYRYGFDLSFEYYHSKTNNGPNSDLRKRKKNLFTPGLNLVFGLNYIIGDHLIVGAELMPYLKYTFGQTAEKRISGQNSYNNEVDHSDIRGGFDSSSVLLSLAYRF